MLIMMRSFLLFSLLFIFQLAGRAQITIKGKVVDGKSNLGIGFVTVSLLSPKDSALVQGQITDSAGAFELPNILPGRYILLLSSLGYQPLYKAVLLETLPQNRLHLGNIFLTADPNLMNEVVVTGSKPAFQRLADKLVLNIAGNRFYKTAANTFDILKKIPGLEVGGDGSLQMSGRITPTVFIDGKPTPMSPEELQNYLASLSPDMIASIEVIANPSAQYDAEHKAIIDIKLKRDMALGWKGNLSSNIQQNAYTLADNNFLLTYKTRKFAFTTRLGYMTGTRVRTYNALQHLANTNIMATSTNILTGNNNLNYQLGVDYDINKRQHIAVLLRAYQLNRPMRTTNNLHTTDSSTKQVVSDTRTNNNAGPDQDNYAVNLNYTARFKKSQLQFVSTVVKIINRQKEDMQISNVIEDQLLGYWKTALKNDILIRTAQGDLSGDAGKGKWGIGAKFAFTTTRNDLRYDTLRTDNVFVPDSGRTNNFIYKEYITAGYISYERKWKKLTTALSLRAEHTHSVANAITQQQVTVRDYLTWLPAFGFTYNVDENNQLHFSYTRRMTRPNFGQLNPFRFYFSPLNYWIGNPYLQASTTNVLRVAYSRKVFSLSFHIGRESDPMTRYPEYDSVTNILEYLGKNLPYNDFAGIEVSFPLIIAKWWRMSHNIGGYYKKEQTPYHNVTYAIPIWDYSISGSQVFTLPKGFTFDIYYNYHSRSGSALYIQKPVYNIDLGLQRTWLKGTLNSRINVYDVFNTYAVRYIFREKSIINNEFVHWFGTQRLSLTLSYSFGKSTHKADQTNKNEEENRAGM